MNQWMTIKFCWCKIVLIRASKNSFLKNYFIYFFEVSLIYGFTFGKNWVEIKNLEKQCDNAMKKKTNSDEININSHCSKTTLKRPEKSGPVIVWNITMENFQNVFYYFEICFIFHRCSWIIWTIRDNRKDENNCCKKIERIAVIPCPP